MPVWFLLSVCVLALFSGGCASVGDERLDHLASEVRAQEVRLAMLEDAIASLGASGAAAIPRASAPQATMPRDAAPTQPALKAAPSITPPAAAGQTVLTNPATPPVRGKGAQLAEQNYQKALATLEGNKPQAALGLFKDFTRAYPGHTLMPNAMYWIGECLYSQKQYDAAILAFKDVVAQYPAHPKAAAAMLKAGYSYALLGDIPNARFYLEVLVKDYPSSAPAGLARVRLTTL